MTSFWVSFHIEVGILALTLEGNEKIRTRVRSLLSSIIGPHKLYEGMRWASEGVVSVRLQGTLTPSVGLRPWFLPVLL